MSTLLFLQPFYPSFKSILTISIGNIDSLSLHNAIFLLNLHRETATPAKTAALGNSTLLTNLE